MNQSDDRRRSQTLPGPAPMVTCLVVLLSSWTSCSVPDPTDDSYFSRVQFRNDTGATARLFDCADDGTDCHWTDTLKPGERTTLSVEWAKAPPADFSVRTAKSNAAKWLRLRITQRDSGSLFLLSEATAKFGPIARDMGNPHPIPSSDAGAARTLGFG